MFSYGEEADRIVVKDVSDEIGWKECKNLLLRQVGGNSIPVICIGEIDNDNLLVLHHEHDGRDLQINHATKVVEHTKHLWKNDVKLITMIDNAPFEI